MGAQYMVDHLTLCGSDGQDPLHFSKKMESSTYERERHKTSSYIKLIKMRKKISRHTIIFVFISL